MKSKEFKIVSDGKEVAVIDCAESGFSVKCTENGRKLCKELCGGFKGCC